MSDVIYTRTPVMTHRVSKSSKKEWYKPLMDYNKIQSISDGTGAKVAVLDDGIDRTHKYLIGRVKVVYELTSENFETGFHATHVAGIVASKKHGIFPNVDLGCFKVLTAKDGLGTSSWIAEGIKAAKLEGYEVINASLGADQNDRTIETEVIKFCEGEKNFFVCASGNDGGKTDYPAALSATVPGVISVGAVMEEFGQIRIAAFSSMGAVTIVAPGVDILSTLPEQSEGMLSGTSMAAPFISSMIAVCKTLYPEFDHQTFEYLADICTLKISDSKHEGKGFVQMADFLSKVKSVNDGLIIVPKVNRKPVVVAKCSFITKLKDFFNI